MYFLKAQSISKTKKFQPEHDAQVTFIKYARYVLGKKYRLIFAIPNGGKRDPRQGKWLKDEGLMAGVPDIFLALPGGGYAGLFIEMKSMQ